MTEFEAMERLGEIMDQVSNEAHARVVHWLGIREQIRSRKINEDEAKNYASQFRGTQGLDALTPAGSRLLGGL